MVSSLGGAEPANHSQDVTRSPTSGPFVQSSTPPNENQHDEDNEKSPPQKKSIRFGGIIAAICVTGLLSALENTVVTTSLPTIVNELEIGDNYIWITNIFFVTRFVSRWPSDTREYGH